MLTSVQIEITKGNVEISLIFSIGIYIVSELREDIGDET